MSNRIELLIYNYKKIEEINIDRNIGSIYIKVDLNNLSKTRKILIENNYTTRLIIIKKEQEDNIFYIYGKKQKNKGVFNEHCKNTVFNEKNYIQRIIQASSNENDIIETDDINLANDIKNEKRNYIKND